MYMQGVPDCIALLKSKLLFGCYGYYLAVVVVSLIYCSLEMKAVHLKKTKKTTTTIQQV